CSTPFPYTTLFRSVYDPERDRLGLVRRLDVVGGLVVGELFDVGEGDDFEEVSVGGVGQPLGDDGEVDRREEGEVLPGGEGQVPLPHADSAGDGGQGDVRELGDQVGDLLVLAGCGGPGEDDDL